MKLFVLDQCLTKSEINQRLANIQQQTRPHPMRECVVVLSIEAQDFIRAYISLGPRKDLLRATQIDVRWWRKYPEIPGEPTPVFTFLFSGERKEVAYRKFLDDEVTAQKKHYDDEMRILVAEQTKPPARGLEVDHVWPRTFKMLTEFFWWYRRTKRKLNDDNGNWREDWLLFHSKYAELQAVTRAENAKRNGEVATSDAALRNFKWEL